MRYETCHAHRCRHRRKRHASGRICSFIMALHTEREKKPTHYINIWRPTKMETKNQQQVQLMLKASFIIYMGVSFVGVHSALTNKCRVTTPKNLNS